MKPFADFLKTEAGQRSCDPAFREMLIGTGGGKTIGTQDQLVKFARDRWRCDIKKSMMTRLWAAYLDWAEGGEGAH
jgi:hypothetical protein